MHERARRVVLSRQCKGNMQTCTCVCNGKAAVIQGGLGAAQCGGGVFGFEHLCRDSMVVPQYIELVHVCILSKYID